MATHTPSPWKISAPWSGFSKISGPNGELIFGLAAGSTDEKRGDAECEANAALIEAAPDLLAACKAQHEAIDILFAMLIARSPPGGTFHPTKSGQPWEALLAGHAAIAKATAP